MKRCVLTILVFLLLGAIANVTLAWGCASWSVCSLAQGDVTHVDRTFWLGQPEVQRFFRPLAQDLVVKATYERGTGIEHRVVRASMVDRRFGQTVAFGCRAQIKAGWPLPCLAGDAEIVGDRWTTRGVLASRALTRYVRITDPPWEAMPIRIERTSFALNTLLYSTVFWLLFAAPFALRRWSRIRRGLCPVCGYDLRGRITDSNVCPECGANA